MYKYHLDSCHFPFSHQQHHSSKQSTASSGLFQPTQATFRNQKHLSKCSSSASSQLPFSPALRWLLPHQHQSSTPPLRLDPSLSKSTSGKTRTFFLFLQCFTSVLTFASDFLGLKFTGSAEVGQCKNFPGGFTNNITSGKAKPGFRCTVRV